MKYNILRVIMTDIGNCEKGTLEERTRNYERRYQCLWYGM